MFKRVMQPMRDFLDRLNQFSEKDSDPLGGRGRIVQFMRQAGGHCAERLQLFLLSRGPLEIAKTRHHRPEDFRGDLRTASHQAPKCLFGENDQPGVAFGARGEDVRRAEQQRDFTEKRTGSVASDNAVLLQGADFSLKEDKKMASALPFTEEQFAGGKPPFFSLLEANLVFRLELGKERYLAEQARRGFGLR